MSQPFVPENVDLAEVAAFLRESCGKTVLGSIVGRTILCDEVVRRLECSLLDGENVVDTMISRGFIVQRETPDGDPQWVIEG